MVVTDSFVLFWNEDDIYSNFHPSRFQMEGRTFHWSEQAFMWLKAVEFGDAATAGQILSQTPLDSAPLECKRLGRKVSPFSEAVWSQRSVDAMRKAVFAKFSQLDELKSQLLDSGGRVLVEASPYDKIWGIGWGESDPQAQDPSQWRGRNLLGQVLMEVREALREGRTQIALDGGNPWP